jgi:hypothetical protein
MIESFDKEFEKMVLKLENTGYLQKIRVFINKIQSSPLILYGAGVGGQYFYKLFLKSNIAVTAFCDSNRTGNDITTGIKIVSPQALILDYQDANVLITSTNYYDEIKEHLLFLKFPEKQILSNLFLCNIMSEEKEISLYIAGYRRIFDQLADEKSKKILIARMEVLWCCLSYPSLPRL